MSETLTSRVTKASVLGQVLFHFFYEYYRWQHKIFAPLLGKCTNIYRVVTMRVTGYCYRMN